MMKRYGQDNHSLAGDIFSPEGPTVSILDRFSDLVILNILCILSCIPIVTAGLGISAACSCSLKICRGQGIRVFQDFWIAWKRDWKQVTPVWIVVLLLWILFGIEYQITAGMSGSMQRGCRGILTVAALALLSVSVYLFPYLSVFISTGKKAVKDAAMLSIANLPQTILMLCVVFVPVITLLLFPDILGAMLLFLLIIGIEGIIMINCMIFQKITKIQENCG